MYTCVWIWILCRLYIAVYGYVYLFMALYTSYTSVWLRTTVYGYVYLCAAMYTGVRLCIPLYGYVYLSMATYSSSSKLLYLHDRNI